MKYLVLYIGISWLLLIQCKTDNTKKASQQSTLSTSQSELIDNPQTVSLLGKSLRSPEPTEALILKWKEKKKAYESDSLNIDNVIWYGRFTAYMGDYIQAINIYTQGLISFPEEARLYRHRGHRYITLRKFEKAIEDFEKARTLIEGTDNEIEPDGMPNTQNIPVSTLHGNIFYHLGLAYYLEDNLEAALEAYESCLATSERPDNVVSAVHWLYMILLRLNRPQEANQLLDQITPGMEIIENHSYHKLCLFYKGALNEASLLDPDGNTSANDAVKYGLANWKMFHDQAGEGLALMREIVGQDSWPSFGYIAAEADLARRN